MRDTDRERGRDTEERQAPCREPNVGFDPRTPGSRPGLQAALNRCATRAALIYLLLMRKREREAGSMQGA